MNPHDYVMALAMNHDPATVIVGNTKIPVLITDVESKTMYGAEPDTTFTCQVVNVSSRATFADRFTPEEKAAFCEMVGGRRGNTGKAYFQKETILAGMFSIARVYFNDPVTVVLWKDGTKTIVRCQEGDTYSAETGLALCFAKKALGNKGGFNDVFKKYIPVVHEPETATEEAETKDAMHRDDVIDITDVDVAARQESEIKED